MKLWLTVKKDENVLRSEFFYSGKPVVLGLSKQWILDWDEKASKLLVTPMGSQKNVPSVNLMQAENGFALEDYSIQIKKLPEFDSIAAGDIEKSKSQKVQIAWNLYPDAETQRFNKFLKHSSITSVGLMLAIFAWQKVFQAANEMKDEPVPTTVALKMDAKKSAALVAAADSYAKSMEKGATQLEKIKEASQKKSAAAPTPVKGVTSLKAAFAGLLGGGIGGGKGNTKTTLGVGTRGTGVEHANFKGLSGVGNGGTTAGGVGYGKGSVVNASLSNSAGTGYRGVGGGGQAGAVDGQGTGAVNLNLAEAFVDEGLSRDEVGRIIHAHISEIRYCYESSMIHNPDIEGKLMVDFTIAKTGMVKTALVKESSVRDERLNECILKRLAKWEFPKPKAGVEVAVSYPFIFKRLTR